MELWVRIIFRIQDMHQPESTANTSLSMASALTKGEEKNWENLKIKQNKNNHTVNLSLTNIPKEKLKYAS